MKTLILVPANENRNGILIKKTTNDVNSCELRKVSISGRDNGYIASVNKSGTVISTGLSWRGKLANSPIDMQEVHKLVEARFSEIETIINQ